MKSGIDIISEERNRQIEKEGWTIEHDVEHDRNELLSAAVCYCRSSEACHYSKNNVTFSDGYRPNEGVPRDWPWGKDWWKPTGDPIRDLAKAGALISAEIDRLLAIAKARDLISVENIDEENTPKPVREKGYYWCYGKVWSDKQYWGIYEWDGNYFWSGDEDFSEDSFTKINEKIIKEPNN